MTAGQGGVSRELRVRIGVPGEESGKAKTRGRVLS